MPEKSALKLTNIFRTLLFTDINFTDFIFTDIIIHAKTSSVKVMSVIIMSDNANHTILALFFLFASFSDLVISLVLSDAYGYFSL